MGAAAAIRLMQGAIMHMEQQKGRMSSSVMQHPKAVNSIASAIAIAAALSAIYLQQSCSSSSSHTDIECNLQAMGDGSSNICAACAEQQ